MLQCPVCAEPLEQSPSPDVRANTLTVSCVNCGTYIVTAEALGIMKDTPDQDLRVRAIISHTLRGMCSSGVPRLTSNLLHSIIKRPLPTPLEQCDNLILWLGRNLSFPGHEVWIEPKTHRAVLGAVNRRAYQQVIRHLEALGLIESSEKEQSRDRSHTTLSATGWSHFQALTRRQSISKLGFMAMKFGDSQLDMIVETCFKPAAAKAGFGLERLDDNQSAGLIDDHLRVALRNARFVVADLSHANQGVYWEAGFAEGLGKPVIYTCEKVVFETAKTHFDTNHHLTIIWDKENLVSAASKLTDTLRATLPEEARMND